MSPKDKPLVILHGDIQSPPMGARARREAGFLLRRLQQGEVLGMPQSRPMPIVGPRVSELRIRDPERSTSWRILYRVDEDMVIVAGAFEKKTGRTPKRAIETCRKRLAELDRL